MKEIVRALTKVITQFLLDWKMPAFRCMLYATIPAAIALKEGLMEYNDSAAVPELAWTKIKLSAVIAGLSAVAAYLDNSYAKTRDAIKERNGSAPSFQTEFVKKSGTEPANKG